MFRIDCPYISHATKGITVDVLVVDDNLLMQEVMRRFLSGLGYTVRVTSRGDEAVQLVRSSTPALILLDMYLPDGTGVEVLRAIRALPNCTRIPVIGMSGMDEFDASQMLTTEFNDYISKPIDLGTLETVVRRYLAFPPQPVTQEQS